MFNLPGRPSSSIADHHASYILDFAPPSSHMTYPRRSLDRYTENEAHRKASREMKMADIRFNQKFLPGRSRRRPYRDRDRPTPTSNGFFEVPASPPRSCRSLSPFTASLVELVTPTSSTSSLPSLSVLLSGSSPNLDKSSHLPGIPPDSDTSFQPYSSYAPSKNFQPLSRRLSYAGVDQTYQIPWMRSDSSDPLDTEHGLSTCHEAAPPHLPPINHHLLHIQPTFVSAFLAHQALQAMVRSQLVVFTDPVHVSWPSSARIAEVRLTIQARVAVAYIDIIQPFADTLDCRHLICDILFYFSVSIYDHIQSFFRQGRSMPVGSKEALELIMDRMERATGQILQVDHITLRDLVEVGIGNQTFFSSSYAS
jgi:hypothetical protein